MKTQIATVEYPPTSTPSPAFEAALLELNERHAQFVRHYLICGEGAEAARRAGYSTKSARKEGSRILALPKVRAAIEIARADLAKKAAYDQGAAMAELDQAIAFARETQNATALCRAIELKSKLCGLLIERQDVRQLGGFAININGLGEE